MTYFIVAFLVVYGWFNLYFLQHLKVFELGRRAKRVAAAWLGLMVLAPLAVRGAERAGLESVATVVAFTGYLWMGFIFMFFIFALLVNLGVVLALAFRVAVQAPRPALTPAQRQKLVMMTIALAAAAVAYGSYEANAIRTERVSITTAKLAVPRLRIAQISDVHLGLILGEDRLARILDAVRAAEPDLLVSTGDLVDGDMTRVDGRARLLAEYHPRYGKFAVTGNHEMYAGLDQALAFHRAAGFVVLRGEAVTIGGTLRLAGVDDAAIIGGEPGWRTAAPVRPALLPLSPFPSPLYTVLLKHRPVVSPREDGSFDLQLSGHLHGGQIFPFGLVPYSIFGYLSGLYPLANGSLLYVSRGSGTWGPPIRVLAPPEVTIIDLVREDPR